MKVYNCINQIQTALSKTGISKDNINQAQRYKFRGIDDVYNALAPLLSKYGLCMLPEVMERTVVERVNQKGTALFYITVKVKYTFVAAEDGSKHEVIVYGEAMDSGDKATNKALSAAYKYAALQVFCIPVEGDNDTENSHHEVKYNQPANTYDRLVTLIKDRKLEKNVQSFCNMYKVNKLKELQERQMLELIERITNL